MERLSNLAQRRRCCLSTPLLFVVCALLSSLLDGWQANPNHYFVNSGTVLVTKDNVDTFEDEVRAITARIMGELETKYLSPPR